MPFGGNVRVIVVPDDDTDSTKYPPGILAMLGPDTVLMSAAFVAGYWALTWLG